MDENQLSRGNNLSGRSAPTTDCEAIGALTMLSIKGISHNAKLELLQKVGSFSNLMDEAFCRAIFAEGETIPKPLKDFWRNSAQALKTAESAATQLDGLDCAVIPVTGNDYPDLLRETASPPLALFVQGNVDALHMPQLAVVGSRRATTSGLESAKAFSRHLAASGLAITSGLASGVDAAAHRGALQTGKTVAVAGTGLDRVYPSNHGRLRDEILKTGGAVVSEFLPGTPPMARNFPQRNRIISGLSLGVLVVEAAVKSGSLITARNAAEQGREVFAIPGSIHNPLSRGCHHLIRQGATLVSESSEILEELGGLLEFKVAELSDGGDNLPAQSNEASLSPQQQAVVSSLGYDPVSLDSLVERLGISVQVLNELLLGLELSGVVSVEHGRVSRVR